MLLNILEFTGQPYNMFSDPKCQQCQDLETLLQKTQEHVKVTMAHKYTYVCMFAHCGHIVISTQLTICLFSALHLRFSKQFANIIVLILIHCSTNLQYDYASLINSQIQIKCFPSIFTKGKLLKNLFYKVLYFNCYVIIDSFFLSSAYKTWMTSFFFRQQCTSSFSTCY